MWGCGSLGKEPVACVIPGENRLPWMSVLWHHMCAMAQTCTYTQQINKYSKNLFKKS